MKALHVIGPDQLALREVEVPRFGPDEVLVAVKYSLMCSSDLKLIAGDFHGLELPLVPGHEWSGVVADAPREHRDLVGRKVVADILMPCLTCDQCRRGRRNLCERLSETGINRNGGFAEYVVVKAANVIPLPDEASLKHAPLIEPLAVAYNAVQRIGGVRPAERVLVLGAGVVGLLATSLASAMGAAELMVADPVGERLRLARACGATRVLQRKGAELAPAMEAGELPRPDVVIDATGDATAFTSALEVVRPGGRLAYISYAGGAATTFTPSTIMLKELTIYGVLSPTETWLQAREMVCGGRIPADRLITHEFRLEEYERLVSMMRDRRDGIVRGAFVFGTA